MIKDHADAHDAIAATGLVEASEGAPLASVCAVPAARIGEFQDDQNLGLGSAYALLCAVFGDRIPNGPLGPDTVSAAVLALPIELATEELVRHAKKCRNMRCPHVPLLLQRYRRMRPDAIRKAKEQVHKVLWTDPNHELVVRVRKQILDKHGELATEISTGTLLLGDRLGKALQELAADGPQILAAVLWASGFKGSGAETLFRILLPIVEGEVSQRLGTDRDASSDDGRLRKVKAKLAKAVRERERGRRAAEQATRDLQLKARALERLKRELEDAHREHRELSEVFDYVERRLRTTEAAYRSLEHDAQIGTKTNTALRNDLRVLQQTQAGLELGRSELALQVAVERRRVEHSELQLAAVPRGTEAVMAFLRAESERIRTDRIISSGGAKERAEQEWRLYRKLEIAFLDLYPQYRRQPPVRIQEKTSLRLRALGGSGEIGRSCYLLELGKHRILVDCGIKPGASKDLHPEIDHLEHLDALILTHAHTDHIGWVPALIRQFPALDIYCSEGTAALLPVMLEDCRGHYVRKMARLRDRARYISNAEPIINAYEEEDVLAVSKRTITCGFEEEQALPFGDLSIRFYRAGHILGAASVLVQDQSGRRIFFSGDFSSFPQLTLAAADWPHDLGDVDLLVLESTYGGKEHRNFDDSRRELVSFIRKTIESEGSVILASFALGRAQELLKLLASASESGELPGIPVYIDGMIKRINPIYRKLATFELPPGFFSAVSGETERQEVAFAAKTEPSIIVTTSGMLAGGPVIQYARHLLPDPRHRIVLTGYQDEGAPSRALLEITSATGQRVVTLEDERGEPVKFEAASRGYEVKLSAHADQPGLLEYAGRLRPKRIALVHGEASAQEKLRAGLLKVHPNVEITCGPSEFAVP